MERKHRDLIGQEQAYYKNSYKNYWLGYLFSHERFYQGRYLLHLRNVLYYKGKDSVLSRALYYYHKMRMNHYSTITGLQLEANLDFGIRLYHSGWIVINGGVISGRNLVLYPGVTIGQTGGKRENVPVIGNNVWIYQNAMVCGKIKIGDNVIILANSVVTHDVPDNVIVGGNPAKIIRTL